MKVGAICKGLGAGLTAAGIGLVDACSPGGNEGVLWGMGVLVVPAGIWLLLRGFRADISESIKADLAGWEPAFPTPLSMRNTPCRCNFFQHAVRRPDDPVFYDEPTNEFRIRLLEGVGEARREMEMVLHHCPMCGGAAPRSRRDRLFATIPEAELDRLRQMTGDIVTLHDAVARLGPPDEELPEDTAVGVPHTLLYRQLSQVADVAVLDHGREAVGISIGAKYVGAPPSKQ